MPRYTYALVEGTYVVRQSRSRGGAEYLTPEGAWVDYPDLWDVTMNGRPIASEEKALETAEQIFERNPEWWAWQSGVRAGDEAYRRGHLGEAERHWTAGLEFEARMGSTRSLDNLAMLYQAQGKYTEAEPLHARALAIMDRTPGPNPPGLSERLKIHAAVLRKLGRDAEAAKKEARATAIRKTKPAPERARRLGWTRLWRWLLRRRKRTAKVATARAGRRKTPE